MDLREAKTIKTVADTVETTVFKCFNKKPVEQMTDEEINKSVLAALPTKTIRAHHGPVLNESIKMLMEDDRYKGDALTASFPPTSPLLETLVNEAFFKIVLGIVERVYNANAEKSDEKQPHIFKGKQHVVPASLDRVDRAAINVTRNALHDPRCKTRRLLVMLLFYYKLPNAGTVKLLSPDAAKPASTKGAESAYFAVRMELLATCSGLLPVGDEEAPKHRLDAPVGSPLAGVHKVVRHAHLYDIARTVLTKIARQPYAFDPEVIFSLAETLYNIVKDDDCSWTAMELKQAEEIRGVGAWALLLPRAEVRTNIAHIVQTLSAKEKDAIKARHREASRVVPSPGGSGAGGSSSSTDRPGQSAPETPSEGGRTDWLRRLAK